MSDTTTTPALPHLFIHKTLGALEIGTTICVFLFGIVTVQTYLYFRSFPRDDWKLKALVGWLWLLELGHTITVTEEIYVKTINEYGQPATIASFSSFYASVILSAFIDFTAQAFFAYRIKKFSGKWIAAGICGFAAFVRLVMIVMGGVLGSVATDVVQFQAKWGWLVTSMLALGAAIDVTVAVSLCFYLRQHRNSPFTSTIQLIDKLMIWAIQTGLLTSIVAVVVVICDNTMKDNFVALGLFTLLAKLYSNSVLAVLNGRTIVRSRNTEAGPSSTPAAGMTFAPPPTRQTDTTDNTFTGTNDRRSIPGAVGTCDFKSEGYLDDGYDKV